MYDDPLLENERNRQFELRTGLTTVDRSKYWNSTEAEIGKWESKGGRVISRRMGAVAAAALVVMMTSPFIIAKLARSSSDQPASADTADDPIIVAARVEVDRRNQARETVERFLAADSVGEMAKYVCDPQRVLPLMHDYYQDHPIPEAIALTLGATAPFIG